MHRADDPHHTRRSSAGRSSRDTQFLKRGNPRSAAKFPQSKGLLSPRATRYRNVPRSRVKRDDTRLVNQVLKQLCVEQRKIQPGPTSRERWLVTYPHASNGLANRLGGLRTSFALAQASGRRFAVRWREWLEGAFLQPPPGSTRYLWDSTEAPLRRLEPTALILLAPPSLSPSCLAMPV